MTGHINVMLVLQSCTDSLQVISDSSTETFPASSGGTHGVGNVKFAEHTDMKEEEEVNVKRENIIISEEVQFRDIRDADCIYSEEEKEENEEDIYTQEEEEAGVKEEVS
jgi:hypothetical protein